ncbi:hypothetical protein ABI59_04685 [Acidobacteria bacterium Mor1]|nr:hypothetical protein ABI59_04685 [Acidobacteria bacterium Mor1]
MFPRDPDGGEPLYASVAIPVPLRRLFTYEVPETLTGRIEPGTRVRVPFGPRRLEATVVAFPVDPPEEGVKVKPMTGLVEGAPAIDPGVLELTRFVADYYLCSWGEAIETSLPPDPGPERRIKQVSRAAGVDLEAIPARARAQREAFQALPETGSVPLSSLSDSAQRAVRALAARGQVTLETVAAGAPATPSPGGEGTPRFTLTDGQAAALGPLIEALDTGRYHPFLLFGSTGSGKTEVYLRAAEHVLAAGRGVLYLVPEIGLTPLLVSKLRRRFGEEIAVLHSGLPARERHRAWDGLRRGRLRFAVGARSAIFAPVADLGLIVIDEEQDSSYKQEETPRYNARDLAMVRARHHDATVVLGSATPSMESFHHAREGRYRLLSLGGRVVDRPLPRVAIVDMRKEFVDAREVVSLSRPLIDALEQALERGEQAMVLRNRRGWAAVVHCPRCGYRFQCDHCSIAMTWHRSDQRLKCHYCDRQHRFPEACAQCGFQELQLLGEGTEKIEDALRRHLPSARIERLDRDRARRKGAHEDVLRRFDAGEIDLLVGTQMIAKGHDFPNVTVVGVLSADHSLGIPDFRAGERTFQLLTQVAGRAGRGERPGAVVVQAFEPDHPVIRLAAKHDYESFFEQEIRYRRALRYPPLSAMVQLRVVDRELGRAREWARTLSEALQEAGGERLLIAGPGPAPLELLRGKYRQQILVRSAGRRRLVETVGRALDRVEGKIPSRAIQVDVDPLSLM